MKILDKYIVKNFLVPFFATFFVVLFVLVMQTLWWAFNDIAGKGIDLWFVLKYLGYASLSLTPMALPIGVLLSSIMSLGNFSENYELAATKSAGISLKRLIRPLVFLILILSGINFLFLNNVYPYAMFKQRNLYLNMKKQKPALALVAKSFNNEIPGYSIKFEEKYGPDENLLKDVMIYDLKDGQGTDKIIRAKYGEIYSEKGSRYMTLILKDGFYFEDHIKRRNTEKDLRKMPASTATFDVYTINIDISSFSDADLDKELRTNYAMLSVKQLDKAIDSLKKRYDSYLAHRYRGFLKNNWGDKLYNKPDSLISSDLDLAILENFETTHHKPILAEAITNCHRQITKIGRYKETFKNKRKNLNNYDYEINYRVAFSLSCLLLFFIGAPLGAIIRKGGFGLPMVMAIVIFVIYFFVNAFSKNISEESTISANLGAWLATFLLMPFGFFLAKRATKGIGIFNIGVFLYPIGQYIKKLKPNI